MLMYKNDMSLFINAITYKVFLFLLVVILHSM